MLFAPSQPISLAAPRHLAADEVNSLPPFASCRQEESHTPQALLPHQLQRTPTGSSLLGSSVASVASLAASPPADLPIRQLLDTVVILDWDDTLFASSWVSDNAAICGDITSTTDPFSPDSKEAALFHDLEDCILDLLTRAMDAGSVCIVTNAETGWVQLSAQRYLPRIVPLLECVPIISARSTYEPFFPNCPTVWKVQAFYERVSQALLLRGHAVGGLNSAKCDALARCSSNSSVTSVSSLGSVLSVASLDLGAEDGCDAEPKPAKPRQQAPINFISIGDSLVERTAQQIVSNHFCCARTKSVKLVEHPTIEQVIHQLELVTEYMDHLVEEEGDLDLVLGVPDTPAVPAVSSPSQSLAQSSSFLEQDPLDLSLD
eukprot:gnl/Hemi2/10563_TR3652_c0_g2_i1.p1 gnl/Hemi2/10563_TR3652_c0_g2~~gnl/Hemi2/10563_TR3652_c0_g2_i1.p1  ORF type:complete len:375 (+),score=113.03 gnl/Hemi2/10563_TR3652_c0_g2_i1:187-1311(+)